jgi:hypothetical protein
MKLTFETKPTPESKEYAELADLILVSLQRLTVELILESRRSKSLSLEQFRVSSSLMLSACSVGSLLPNLIEERSIRLPFALPVVRMFYERLLSSAYVLSDKGEAAESARLYAVYTTFKNQKKLFSVGPLKTLISEPYKLSRKAQIVKAAIEYFESGPGKASKVEFTHDRNGRIEKVTERWPKTGILFKSVELAGYSSASEIIPGSYLSTTLYGEVPDVGTPQKGFDEAIVTIMTVLVLSAEAVGRAVNNLFPDLPSPPLLIRAGETFFQHSSAKSSRTDKCGIPNLNNPT